MLKRPMQKKHKKLLTTLQRFFRVLPVTQATLRKSSDRSRLPKGPTSIWISRQTHSALREHAQRTGRKLQWLADRLIKAGLQNPELN